MQDLTSRDSTDLTITYFTNLQKTLQNSDMVSPCHKLNFGDIVLKFCILCYFHTPKTPQNMETMK